MGRERKGSGQPGIFKGGFKLTGAQLPQGREKGLEDVSMGGDFSRFHEILKLELIHSLNFPFFIAKVEKTSLETVQSINGLEGLEIAEEAVHRAA